MVQLLVILSITITVAGIAFAIWKYRKFAYEVEELSKFKQNAYEWKCPYCSSVFGDQAPIAFYGNGGVPADHIFANVHAIVVCNHCGQESYYDKMGGVVRIPRSNG